MLDRRFRRAGDQAIEAELTKRADLLLAPTIPHPTLASLKAQKTKELGSPSTTAQAVVPKVLSAPSSTLR